MYEDFFCNFQIDLVRSNRRTRSIQCCERLKNFFLPSQHVQWWQLEERLLHRTPDKSWICDDSPRTTTRRLLMNSLHSLRHIKRSPYVSRNPCDLKQLGPTISWRWSFLSHIRGHIRAWDMRWNPDEGLELSVLNWWKEAHPAFVCSVSLCVLRV